MSDSGLNLSSELVPGVSAAGFTIGDSFVDISNKIGFVDWYGPEAYIRDALIKSKAWIGVKRKIGFEDEIVLSYRYMDELVSLYFEEKNLLYRIAVGKGYQGGFEGVRPGDDLRSLEENYDVLFNDADDEFLIEKEGVILTGISFVTDYRASLEHAPSQVIQYISIHDWSLR